MRRLLNLSFRYKIPLWGSFLIIATAVIISAVLLFRAYTDLKQDLLRNAASQGRMLATSLFPTLLHDDVWRSYELINAPFHGATPESPAQVETLLVVNRERQVYVSTQPEVIPILTPLADIAPAYKVLADEMEHLDTETRVIEPDGADQIFVVTPIAEETARLGALVQVFSKSVLLPRFLESADRAALMAGVVLTILLPINWYWGQRTAEPLLRLTARMESLGRGEAHPLPPGIYDYGDEFGRLFETYNRTAQQLREKAVLEKQLLQAERLTAVGRLAAGIAHEVNNPLGGMLMAIDNLKQRGPLDAATTKTVALLERGLQQVTETIGALLVESRVSCHPLSRHDFEDVRTLVEPQIVKKQIALEWHVNLPETLSPPASIVRQILINLLLNATQATAPGGFVRLYASADAGLLHFEVANQGGPLPAEIRSHLFEPFVSGREGGHGLGLWVTYQTVVQLNGRIDVADDAGEVRFAVRLPLENKSA